mmetsp:Transcript_42755/g.96425  ORF Transcript_42755/g.96425 Transcript_42755/m.96425 type:complete len:217 (+) Transcript_42755:2-652(+)
MRSERLRPTTSGGGILPGNGRSNHSRKWPASLSQLHRLLEAVQGALLAVSFCCLISVVFLPGLPWEPALTVLVAGPVLVKLCQLSCEQITLLGRGIKVKQNSQTVGPKAGGKAWRASAVMRFFATAPPASLAPLQAQVGEAVPTRKGEGGSGAAEEAAAELEGGSIYRLIASDCFEALREAVSSERASSFSRESSDRSSLLGVEATRSRTSGSGRF